MTLFNPTSSLKANPFFTSPTGEAETKRVWQRRRNRKERVDEKIEEAIIGSWVPFGSLDVWVGWGPDCLNAHRHPCVSRLPILWEIRAQEAVRLPGKIPISKDSDNLKCEAAKPPATTKGLIWGSEETDRDGKWASFVKFLDHSATFLLLLRLSFSLPFSPDSSSLSYNFWRCLGISIMRATP